MKQTITKLMDIIKRIIIYGCLIILFQLFYNIVKDILKSLIGSYIKVVLVQAIIIDLISLCIGVFVILLIMKKKKLIISWFTLPESKWILPTLGFFTSYILIYQNTISKILANLPGNPMISNYIMDENTAIYLVVSAIISGPVLEELLVRGLVLKKCCSVMILRML